ncbi:endopeptidase O [Spiroplasma sp. TIUS-1]|uniref:M13 family metallopeptidase n=1 Tax=Spiroplasma sp. TIUS-1 TaxID=216963 RepID=UPI001397E92E|nr:M13 family metallopeptidase [Spiroplasma sp. TIUS-1]QHX36073.1 endopeptidase O [Spiroplasma sp. TIUS-1]
MKTKPTLQNDFYGHVNHEWLTTTEIPTGYSSWGSFHILAKEAKDNVGLIIDEMITNKNKYKENSNEVKVANLYNNFLNFDARNKLGLDPIKHILEIPKMYKSVKDLTDLTISLRENFEGTFFGFGVDQDLKNSKMNILYISTMGLGLGTRDYYNDESEDGLKIKKEYFIYLGNLLKMINPTLDKKIIEAKVQKIYDFEHTMAQSIKTPVESRDVEKQYNPVTIEDLNKLCPLFEWNKFFKSSGLDVARKIILSEPKFLEELNKVLPTIDSEVIVDLMQVDILSGFSNSLHEELWQIGFDFGKVFSGVKEPKPLRERAIAKVEGSLGEILGMKYVEKHFSDSAKKDVIDMIHKMIEVYKVRISKLEWMGEETKKKALHKLDNYTLKIGYPDKWEDYSDVVIKSYEEGSNLVENSLSLARHFRKISMNELKTGKVDLNKWYMNPQEVNAYYNPPENCIAFPAAILQAPFYDYNASLATNLGGIGAVIGHEIIHGFDDEGSKFDSNGNLNDWWTVEDRKQFELITKKLSDQYSTYKVEGLNVKGDLTLGENIADLGGVVATLQILKAEKPEDMDLYFRSFANVEKSIKTPEVSKYLINVDPHSPSEFRVNGVLVNVDEFQEFYNLKEGDEMYKSPEDRIRIW